jgi:protein TonB
MFEQAILESGDSGKRFWTTCAGVTGQLLFVSVIAVAPLIWPQALPRVPSFLVVFTPLPPPPPAVHVEAVRPQSVRIAVQSAGKTLVLPQRIPPHALAIEDPPEAFSATAAAAGIAGGLSGGSAAFGIVGDILDSVRPVAPPLVLDVPKVSVPPEPAAPPRVKVGGLVEMATIVRRVDPAYPVLARQARISGVVQLEGVIGVDGRIRELVVKSGHPLLVSAALAAVRQWIYKPTFLNGSPVEVIAPITVTFHLN